MTRALNGLIALVEQRVEIVDQRLHLRRIRAVEPLVAAVVQGREPFAQLAPTADSPRRTCRNPAEHAQHARQSAR